MVGSAFFVAKRAIGSRRLHSLGPPKIMTAPARRATIALKALGTSASASTCRYWRMIPRRLAATSASFKPGMLGEDGLTITAIQQLHDRPLGNRYRERARSILPRLHSRRDFDSGHKVGRFAVSPGFAILLDNSQKRRFR